MSEGFYKSTLEEAQRLVKGFDQKYPERYDEIRLIDSYLRQDNPSLCRNLLILAAADGRQAATALGME